MRVIFDQNPRRLYLQAFDVDADSWKNAWVASVSEDLSVVELTMDYGNDMPTNKPMNAPSKQPTNVHSENPTKFPTYHPILATANPTLNPTIKPPTPGPPSDYQRLDYGEAACPEGLEIQSESECSQAIAALGITDGGDPWTGSRATMPKGCSLQKATDSMVFNTGEGGSGRHDLAPVCKFTGTSEPVPTPGPLFDYQKLDYGEAACLEGLEINSESECSLAIAALGITDGGDPWTGSRTTMPKGCSLQKATHSMVFNTGEGG